jgi:hypothetical protein
VVSAGLAVVAAGAGALAGTDEMHLFEGAGDIRSCWLCFGWRDDVRHWLSPAEQAAVDAAVRRYEDGRRPVWPRISRRAPWVAMTSST